MTSDSRVAHPSCIHGIYILVIILKENLNIQVACVVLSTRSMGKYSILSGVVILTGSDQYLLDIYLGRSVEELPYG